MHANFDSCVIFPMDPVTQNCKLQWHLYVQDLFSAISEKIQAIGIIVIKSKETV